LRGAKHAGTPIRIAHIRSVLPQGFSIVNPALKLVRNLVVLWGRYWLSQYATNICGVSEAALDERFPQWRKDGNFSVWTLGIDPEEFRRSTRNGLDQERKIIISVGSFIPQRGQHLLLQAYSRVLEGLPQTRLLLVGEGRRLNYCKRLAVKMGLNDKLEFRGLCNNIPELLEKSDIFVSFAAAEGLPNALLEAQSSGLPVVASDIPPHREALSPVAHPFLFPRDRIPLAAERIIRILNDSELYKKLSDAGREHVIKQYNSKVTLKVLEEMYVKSLAER
jgi:glycosyltransferase involved in cell wall biosynthesis